jgi:two-component system cell cycle sensor histidine kinase/response regulator CckA
MPGKVLVVDDDPPLLRTMGVFLARRGYEVVTCGSGNEALEKLQADPGVYSVMVVDMTILGLPAEQLVEKALQMERDLGVIVTSGYNVQLPFSRRHPAGTSWRCRNHSRRMLWPK